MTKAPKRRGVKKLQGLLVIEEVVQGDTTYVMVSPEMVSPTMVDLEEART